MSNTKAVHLKSYKKYVLAHGGEAMFQTIVQQFTDEERKIIEKTVFANEWVDYHLWWRMLVAADKMIGKGDFQLIREIGFFDAQENLNGIYKAFISFMNPTIIIPRSNIMWRRYYDTGTMQLIRQEGKTALLHLIDFPGLPLRHELEIIGWMEGALRITGARNMRVSHSGKCLARGDDHCAFSVAWE